MEQVMEKGTLSHQVMRLRHGNQTIGLTSHRSPSLSIWRDTLNQCAIFCTLEDFSKISGSLIMVC
jgi:hypothetical protein